MTHAIELKLAGGTVVSWQGDDGVDAAQNYANSHPGAVVLAWRELRRGLFPMLAPIIEVNYGTEKLANANG